VSGAEVFLNERLFGGEDLGYGVVSPGNATLTEARIDDNIKYMAGGFHSDRVSV
jgi:hypothetical protein